MSVGNDEVIKMDKKLAFRLLLIPLFLYAFYRLGFPIEIITILGILYIVIVLFRGKIWKTAEQTIERLMPFTKTWPVWAQKILLFLIFFLIYAILKQILFFALGLVGIEIEIEKIIMTTLDANKS